MVQDFKDNDNVTCSTVRGSQGKSKYQGEKVNKDAEKNCVVVHRLRTVVQIFFCSLRLQIIFISASEFVFLSLFLV